MRLPPAAVYRESGWARGQGHMSKSWDDPSLPLSVSLLCLLQKLRDSGMVDPKVGSAYSGVIKRLGEI